jgi:hypothetical protein
VSHPLKPASRPSRRAALATAAAATLTISTGPALQARPSSIDAPALPHAIAVCREADRLYELAWQRQSDFEARAEPVPPQRTSIPRHLTNDGAEWIVVHRGLLELDRGFAPFFKAAQTKAQRLAIQRIQHEASVASARAFAAHEARIEASGLGALKAETETLSICRDEAFEKVMQFPPATLADVRAKFLAIGARFADETDGLDGADIVARVAQLIGGGALETAAPDIA